MRRGKTLLLATLLLLPACGPASQTEPPADAPPVESPRIIGGTTDSGDPAVVLIVNQTAGEFCSGTLIAPTVILTAGHCTVTSEDCNQPACVALAPSTFQVLGGTTPEQNASWTGTVTEVHPHPQLQLDTGNTTTDPQTHDMGILILSAAAPVTPVPWQATASADDYKVGATVELIGFGLTDYATMAGAGTKRSVSTTISNIYPDSFWFDSATANTCAGDSGGPAIIDGVVMGTTSWGSNTANGVTCEGIGADMRTDDNGEFIQIYAPEATPTPGGGSGSSKKGCSVGSTEPAMGGVLPLLALLGLMLVVRRARSVNNA